MIHIEHDSKNDFPTHLTNLPSIDNPMKETGKDSAAGCEDLKELCNKLRAWNTEKSEHLLKTHCYMTT